MSKNSYQAILKQIKFLLNQGYRHFFVDIPVANGNLILLKELLLSFYFRKVNGDLMIIKNPQKTLIVYDRIEGKEAIQEVLNLLKLDACTINTFKPLDEIYLLICDYEFIKFKNDANNRVLQFNPQRTIMLNVEGIDFFSTTFFNEYHKVYFLGNHKKMPVKNDMREIKIDTINFEF